MRFTKDPTKHAKSIFLIFLLVNLSSKSAFGSEDPYRVWTLTKEDACRGIYNFSIPMKDQVLAMGKNKIVLPRRDEFHFRPNLMPIARINPVITDSEMKLENSMYSATAEFALANGGPVTRKLVESVPDWYYKKALELGLWPNIDVRVHDLSDPLVPKNLDIYPAIPGWHCDGEYRETFFGQPDLNRVPVSFHIISTVSTHGSGVSNTEFLNTPIGLKVSQEMPDIRLWQIVHRYVDQLKDANSQFTHDGDVVLFDARSLHRASPVKNRGHRLFFRMSMWHKPNLEEGQLSLQEQLYLLPKKGSSWFKDEASEQTFAPRVIEKFEGKADIPLLAKEPSIASASIPFLQQNGGAYEKKLIELIPAEFIERGKANGFIPIVDVIIFRLYVGYKPIFPNYIGEPLTADFHKPVKGSADSTIERPELYMSMSTLDAGVNFTEFGDKTLKDGEILRVSSHQPRRELSATQRGWRLMLRVSLQRPEIARNGKLAKFQYVDPMTEDQGW